LTILLTHSSGHQSLTRDADVDQTKTQTRPGEKPAEPVQLERYLKEPKKDGPFINLREEQPDGAAETAFIGSWTAK
jgi:hypothetical protein